MNTAGKGAFGSPIQFFVMLGFFNDMLLYISYQKKFWIW
jgi:hypothetical protein